MTLDSLKDLDKLYSESYKNLCHLAYDMTIKSKQVISSQELQAQLGGSGKIGEETGLGLLIVPHFTKLAFIRAMLSFT